MTVILIAVGYIAWYITRKRRSHKLREKFDPEYNYTLNKAEDQRKTEEIPEGRENRVTNLDILALNENETGHFNEEWTEIQTGFEDDPSKTVEEANRLITEVMIARGFPVADFEQRAADISVLYPDFVSNYRSANAIALINQSNVPSTEEFRQAMVYYRSLFEELLGAREENEVKA